MTESGSPPTAFTVRCGCGNEFHTDSRHVGRRLRCNCGRTLTIAAPDPAPAARTRKRRSGSREPAAPVSGASWRRLSTRWIRERAAPFTALAMHDLVHPRASRRWASRAAWLALGALLLTWIALVLLSERFLPATMLAYGPRAVVLVPIALLVPWALVSARRALIPLAVATWIALVPVMGLRFSPTTIGRALPAAAAPDEIRVLTFNVLVGGRLSVQLEEMLRAYSPDLIAFQECGEELFKALQRQAEWNSVRHDGLCTASRWPMSPVDRMAGPEETRVRRPLLGGYGNLVRYLVETPHGPIVFVNLHLPTARYGLQALMAGDDGFLPSDPKRAIGAAARTAAGAVSGDVDAQIRSNRLARALASERASILASSGDLRVPVIVAGDFNLPVESSIYREHWSHFTNAFESVGNGFGHTKREGKLLSIRIDHVLTHRLTPRRAFVQRDWFSDHLPVVVDIAATR